MANCICAPALLSLQGELNTHRPHWVYLGCCGDDAHAARKSDHNPAKSPASARGKAHALDVGEHRVYEPSWNWLVNQIMSHPHLYPQVKYMIYEGWIYYPNDGVRPAGRYPYTGPNSHATHLHISIHTTHTNYTGSWYIGGLPQEEPVLDRLVMLDKDTPNQPPQFRRPVHLIHEGYKGWVVNEPHANYLGLDLSKVETHDKSWSGWTLPTVGSVPPGWPTEGAPAGV